MGYETGWQVQLLRVITRGKATLLGARQRPVPQTGHSQNLAMAEGQVGGEDCPEEFSWLWEKQPANSALSRRQAHLESKPNGTAKVLPPNHQGGLKGT